MLVHWHSCPKEGSAFPGFGGPGVRRQCRKHITDRDGTQVPKRLPEIDGRGLVGKGTQEQKEPSQWVCLEPAAVCRVGSGRQCGKEVSGKAGSPRGALASSAGSGLHPGQRSRRRVLVGSSPSHRRFFLHSHAHTHGCTHPA